MVYKAILVERKDGWAKIFLNRPEKFNAINNEMREELGIALKEMEKDENIKVIVITGKGRAFSAGADLKEIDSYEGNVFRFNLENSRSFHGLFNLIEDLDKPVIAVVNGFALAGGLELAMACDMIITAEDVRLGDQHTNFGLIPGGGNTQRLPRVIGVRRALELILTGDWLTGKEAERIGLVNKAVPAEKLEEATEELVNKLVSKSPLAAKWAKKLVYQGYKVGLKDGLELEIFTIAHHFHSEDWQEGIAAFKEKRKPVFKGK